MTEAVIVARGLTKRFGKVTALDGLDFEVPAGSSVGILGPAGAGKSTLVRMLAGLARPSRGSLTVRGRAAGSVAARHGVGTLLQEARLYGWMTARETLAFAGDLAGLQPAGLAVAIEEVAGSLSLTELLDERVSGLDAAARGRLALGQALVGKPSVLVLDEPFVWLDPDARRAAMLVLRALPREVTIVITAHRVSEIELLCDRLVVLDAGKLVLAAALRDIAAEAARVFVIETGVEGGLALAGLVARLKAEPWVADVGVTGRTVRVVVSDEERAERELLPAVVGTGVPVSVFRREPRSLQRLIDGLPHA